ncbi:MULTISPECIES: DsbA family protein [Actinomycetaceae]|uniref:Thioredoxin-like fold domain-containing protein n=1 Tax=Actinotignum schaalii FB123-CNA-2 TaxID=883067 RepID=S2W0D6_9ACTO|nr:thioredoxin domain-containing protein [Actinotignum schaalii]EPD26027.1 hypothetical protein HMPREF9237_01778 [Actinotignum schaalii FB123-CNA-2]
MAQTQKNNRQSSAAQRRETARAAAARLQEQEKKRARRNRALAVVAAVVVVALIAAAVWFILSNKKDDAGAPATQESSAAAYPSAPATPLAERPAPKVTSQLPKNVTPDVGVSVGSSLAAGTVNEGKPVVDIYFDYLCVWCNRLETAYAEELTQRAKNGEITLVYHPLVVESQYEFSHTASASALWVAEHRPDVFAAYHNEIFAMTAPLFEAKEKVPVPQTAQLAELGKKAGLTDAEAEQMIADVSVGDGKPAMYSELLGQSLQQFSADGFTGTPTVLLNGKQVADWTDGKLTAALDALK